ncbi:Por secretion system C-terminal sorting domain-containing protein [Candidatus Kryptobacter tengchongensis]|nr:Por secretion system C-terminal sorting domain-containing protein [Candidatus Kryptobacter tengchongensis]
MISKKVLLLFYFLILLIQPTFSQVREFYIYIHPDSLYLLYSRSIWDNTWIPIKFVAEGAQYRGEIRFKGHSSRYYPKKPFYIRFKKGSEFEGWSRMGFNAMYTDKSLMREQLTWDLWRAMGMIGPETYYANLYINNKNYGLYLFVERIDETLKRNPEKFGFSPGGSLYEPSDNYHCGDLSIPTDSSNYYLCYEKKFPADSNYSDLIQLIQEINQTPVENFHEFVERRFFSESLINWFVLNTLTHMGDTYNKNYYLYHDSVSDKWLIIPWDYDLSFGRDGDSRLPYPLSLLSDKFKYWYMLPYHGVDNPLKIKFFQNQVLLNKFKQRLDSMLANVFTEERINRLIDQYYLMIKDYVYRDEFKWGTNAEFEEQVEALRYYVTARRYFLYKWLSNFWPGEINKASLKITGVDTVYHFVDKIGRLLCSMWFYEVQALDSVTVIVYPDSVHPYLPADVLPDKFVKRVFKFIPYPNNARFKVKIRVGYRDESLSRTELTSDVLDEKFLKLHYYNGNTWHKLDSYVNYYGNFIIADNLTENEINSNNSFAIFIPVDYRQRWNLVKTYTWNKLNRVRFFDRNIGYIVGETSTFFLTLDGGNSWIQRSFGKEISLNDIAFADSLVYFVGGQGLVYKGRIGDTLMTQVSLGAMDNFKQIGFYNNGRYGFIRGDSLFYYTVDGGNTWDRLNSFVKGETEIIGIDTFITAVDTTLVFWSVSTGDIKSISIGQVVYKIKTFQDGKFIVAVSGDSIYVIKSDVVVARALQNPRAKVNDIKIIDTLKIFLACDEGVMFYSRDGGRSWHLQPVGTKKDIYSIDFVDSLNGWATGVFGLVLSTNVGGVVKVYDRPIAEIPVEFKLYQNYPNPFNSSTKVAFELPYESHIKIEVYDVLGRKIKTLVEGYKPAGLYYVNFNADDLPSGVYFYALKAEGRIFTRKMVLIK